jgi:hypothetical protein
VSTVRVLVLGVIISSLAAVVDAQAPRAGAAPGRRATATRTSSAPLIDGQIDDAVWQQASPITDFVQTEPSEGQPASEKTEVRMLYDDQAIYVAVMCFDSDPGHIVTSDSRRDSALSGQDNFQLIFDTYHDKQNGFIFGTTPLGLQYDAQVRNEGEQQSTGAPALGRTGGGSGGGLNVNWDGAWDVKTKVTDQGWSAEFMIPLRTLRYGPPPQVWGVNFARAIEHKREQVYWSPVARVYNITRLSSAGELRDLNVAAPRNFKIIPYALGSTNTNFFPSTKTQVCPDFESDSTCNKPWGVDAKIGVTSSLNLDLSYNTDFAQVEVDEQQVNLTRFNLLFPEKRPFFLENRGLFAVGKNGEVDLFFSRRIGITDNGALVPIRGGARLSGKAGGLNIGLLDMQTEAVGTVAANNFGAVRVAKDLPNRSSVGGIFVSRVGTGDLAGSENWNRTWGGDGKWGIGEAWTVTGFAARTETPGATEAEHAFSTGIQYQTRQRRTFYEYTEVGGDFNPEVGFLERNDAFRQFFTGWYENVRTPWLTRHGLREWRPHYSYESFWGFDGFQETATLHLDNAWDFERGLSISPAFNVQWEGLREPFMVYPGVVVPPGSYTSPHAAGMFNTDRRKWISLSGSYAIGGFLSGTQNSWAPQLNIRKGGAFTSSLRWTVNDIHLPEGYFQTNLGSLKLAYNFTPLVNAQALIQYNDRTRRWSTNLRFSWLRDAATGLYVVYNDTEGFNGFGPINRSFVVKYSHMFDVLH